MCIAIIKSRGVARPSWDTLELCFNNNPDGAGYAYSNGKNFKILKGFATWESFKASIEALETARGADFFTKVPAFFHFRIGTHGSKDSPEHTHPFPLTNNEEKLNALETRATRIVMHNGILTGYGDSSYGVAKNKMSDTMDFIATFLFPLQRILGDKTFYESVEAQHLVTKQIGNSRVVIMEPDGRSIRWGEWYHHEGCYYSNGGFKESPKKTYAPAKTSYWGSKGKYDTDIDAGFDTTGYNWWSAGRYHDIVFTEKLGKDYTEDERLAYLRGRFLNRVVISSYMLKNSGLIHVQNTDSYYVDATLHLLYRESADKTKLEYLGKYAYLQYASLPKVEEVTT